MSSSSRAVSQKKILFFRLSSFGDVTLASSALQVKSLQGEIHWVVAEEFSQILIGHPRLTKVWSFRRKKSSLGDWVRFCRQLWEESFDEIYDLHGSLRTQVARFLFLFWRIQERKTDSGLKAFQWNKLSRQRWRLWGYFIFKGAWPRLFRPAPLIAARISRFVGGTGMERPDLTHLLKTQERADPTPPAFNVEEWLRSHDLKRREYWCVMPSSAWPTKCWPVERFVDWCVAVREPVVVLGTQRDEASQRLLYELDLRNAKVISAFENPSVAQTAQILAAARAYFGNDTGLGHLAEAVGTPAWVVFGPTAPDMGFGPWRKESQTFSLPLACRPCGKDGRYCHRFWEPYACLKKLEVSDSLKQVEQR